MRERGFEEIHTVTIDVGQPSADIAEAESRAAVLGTRHLTIDAKAEFASDYCFQALAANADYFGYPLSTALARPLIAKKAAEYGLEIGADAFVHGCTGKGNDQFRIELGLRRFAPAIPIIAPIREADLTRTWEIEYAEKVGAPIGQSKQKIWSIDENLWGRSIEGGRLEEPSFEPPEEIFAWTKNPLADSAAPTILEITFEQGSPVCVNGKTNAPHKMIEDLNHVAGLHGVGRIDMMEDRLIGLKVRENYECPAATVLVLAHKALESLVTARDERSFKAIVDAKWAEVVYEGRWWDPLLEDLTAFCKSVNDRVTGSVKLRLHSGNVAVLGRSSPWALYDESMASFDDSDSIRQSEMTGMVRSHAMDSILYTRLKDRHRQSTTENR